MFNFSNVTANTEEDQQSLSLSKEEVSKGDYIKYDDTKNSFLFTS